MLVQILTSPVLKELGKNYTNKDLDQLYNQRKTKENSAFFCAHAKIDDAEIAFLIIEENEIENRTT